ncbi:MAG: biosynthetic peptidoglycan transglycosylase [Clostridia bacterium]|nr:biosynthetic peptidoglycan transglycosylase [Clostridia bacterium]
MKLLKKLLFLILLFVSIILLTYVFNGYSMYKRAITTMSINDKILFVRSNPNFTRLSDVPSYYKNAIIAVEDHRFYEHGTLDYISIGRATVSNLKSKKLVEGGSTITQQVAKNLYFITETDVFSRKVAEVFVGFELEKNYSKDEILEIYINTIYFGDGYYNIKEASMGYFNKKPEKLSLYEATLLAGVPNAPTVYSPTVNLDLALSRQKKVISDMIKYGYLEPDATVTP